MQPNERIVELARNFHLAGGSKEFSVIEDGRWYVHTDGTILFNYNHGDEYSLLKCTPIFSESELWKWLWEWNYRIIQTDPGLWFIQERTQYRDRWVKYSWDTKISITSESLWQALYEAAVWIVEQNERT